MRTVEELLQQAVTQAKAGNKAEAKKILSQVVRAEPKNVRGWYFLSQVVEDKKQALYCLNKVLELEPGNERVEQRIRELEGQTELTEPSISGPTSRLIAPRTDAPQKKKSTPYLLMVVAGAIFVCVLLAILSGGGDSGGNPISGKYKITYHVEGTANTASVTYTNEQGGTEQRDVSLPWDSAIYEMEIGDFASIVTQSQDYSSTIICIIEINGKILKRSESSGDFVIATCTSLLGDW